MKTTNRDSSHVDEVRVPAAQVELAGDFVVPEEASGVVLFAHGSGSSRFSSRNRFVAQRLNEANLATLLIDLLTPREESVDQYSAEHRFDIPLLARRLEGAIEWLISNPRTLNLPVGLFGASTGAAAALVAAARRPEAVGAVVSRGGRPDLAGDELPNVRVPNLLIVGGDDHVVIELNQQAMRQLRCKMQLQIIPGAGHLFEEPGALEKVAELARDWFRTHLTSVSGGFMLCD